MVLDEAQQVSRHRRTLAPFVSSPLSVVKKMLEIAELKPGETLFDLGCGDGRIPIMAAQEFGAFGMGVDLNRRLVEKARAEVKRLDLYESVEIIEGDIFDQDLSDTDVVTMYLTTTANDEVRPKLEAELKEGARVVTHDFSVPTWKPIESLRYKEGYRSHTLHLYRLPYIK